MELLYFGCTSTYPHTFDSFAGVNLSSEYEFKVVERDSSDGCGDSEYLLSINKEWVGYHSVFKIGNIENISVLVGENGSGKTTLLNTIVDCNLVNLDDVTGWRKIDSLAIDELNGAFPNKDKGLLKPRLFVFILRDDHSIIHIYHSMENIKCNELIAHFGSKNIKFHSIGGRGTLDLYNTNEHPFQNFTTIFLSNSSVTPIHEVRTVFRGISSLSLTPANLKRIAGKFYEHLLDVSGEIPAMKNEFSFYSWESIISHNLDERSFQNLVDVLYYNDLLETNRFESYNSKVSTALNVSFYTARNLMENWLQRYDGFKNKTVNLEIIGVVYEAKRCFHKFLPQVSALVRLLYMNLVCEAHFALFYDNIESGHIDSSEVIHDKFLKYAIDDLRGRHIADGNGPDENGQSGEDYKFPFWAFRDGVESIEEVENFINHVIEGSIYFPLNVVSSLSIAIIEPNRKYLRDALEEIHEFREILAGSISKYDNDFNYRLKKAMDKNPNIESGLLEEQLFSHLGLEFSYNTEDINFKDSEYRKGLKFIADLTENEHSFMLRYIKISNQRMSAGERAYQNMFSWMSVIPSLMQKCRKKPLDEKSESNGSDYDSSLRDNLLILLDEADLYMHPQWQKSLIENIIEEVRSQYSDKHIQIVLTTNSPLTLSDVPRGNITYIKCNRSGEIKSRTEVNKKETRSIIDRGDVEMDETFGADVYKLFQNSFFLQGAPMGTYAEKYINERLKTLQEIRLKFWEQQILISKGENRTKRFKELQKSMTNYAPKLDGIYEETRLIGNTAIRNKIRLMIDEIRGWSEENSDTNTNS